MSATRDDGLLERYDAVRAEIARAATEAGRDPAEVFDDVRAALERALRERQDGGSAG